MMDYDDTAEVLKAFYISCRAFWLRECKNTRGAHKKAMEDVERLTTNPFDPNGLPLDVNAKAEFIAYGNRV